MRRIVLFNWVTADGYFAGPAGELDWVVPDDEQAKMAARDIAGFDTALFGRRTYQVFEGFWNHLEVDESGTVPDPHHPGRRSAEHGAIAIALNRMTKLVFSKTLQDAGWNNSHLRRELDPREIKAMKQQPGKDFIIWGSASIVSQLTQEGVIDEYQLVVCPLLLGRGRTWLDGVAKQTKLELLDARPLPSGDVMLRYGRGR
jgi:dihydrofolate reductase